MTPDLRRSGSKTEENAILTFLQFLDQLDPSQRAASRDGGPA